MKIFVLIWGGQGSWEKINLRKTSPWNLKPICLVISPNIRKQTWKKLKPMSNWLSENTKTFGDLAGWGSILRQITPHGRRQIPPGLSFFFLLVFWVGERGGMVLPNVDNWKLSSAQRNILLLFASSCLRSPVNWGFRTENQQQKGHVRGLKNRSGNDVTIWYIRNSYSYFYPCLPVNIHNYILTNPWIYIPIIGLSLDLRHKSDLRLWPLKPNLRGWRGSTSPHDQPRDSMMTQSLNPVKTVQMFIKHPVMIKGINSYMNNLWGDFASPFWTATFEQVANVPSCTTGTKMQMVSH